MDKGDQRDKKQYDRDDDSSGGDGEEPKKKSLSKGGKRVGNKISRHAAEVWFKINLQF